MSKILYLEDDRDLGATTAAFLALKNYCVEWIYSGDEALERLRLYDYDMAVLDWNVEGLDGLSVCQKYRAQGGSIPLLLLTGRGQLQERLSGFDAGADDYLTKPFAPEELAARIRALLKRPQTVVNDILQVGNLALDLKACKLTKSGSEISLMLREYQVLEFLMRNPDRVFSAEELLNKLWSSESDSTEMAVRKCLNRLRNKIDGDKENGYLITVKGLGYKLSDASKLA